MGARAGLSDRRGAPRAFPIGCRRALAPHDRLHTRDEVSSLPPSAAADSVDGRGLSPKPRPLAFWEDAAIGKASASFGSLVDVVDTSAIGGNLEFSDKTRRLKRPNSLPRRSLSGMGMREMSTG
jgi:hypothetical protein